MPLSIALNSNGAQATFLEFDGPNGTGNQVPPSGAVTFASATASVATIDPASGKITPVAAGTTSISGTDAGNNLTASDTLTVTDVAVSATLTLAAL